MNIKKVYAVPRVLQMLEVQLEAAFLDGPSSMSKIEATGHELEHFNTDTQSSESWSSGAWTIE